jgi:hypothetical protein
MIKVTDFNEITKALVKVKNYKKKLITNFFSSNEKVEIWISKDQFFTIEIGEVVFF